MPIGNLTSQIFANIYLNELDKFIKHKLRLNNYFRYTDDFVVVHTSSGYLRKALYPIQYFLENELKLELHPQKISIRKLKQGIDFLGYVILPHHIVLRTKTKKRMFRKIKHNKQKLNAGVLNKESFNQSLQSYLGTLKHCSGCKIRQKIRRLID